MLKNITFTPSNLPELSLFSYTNYLEKGSGFILVSPDYTEENNFSYEYVSGEEALQTAAEPLKMYNPDEEILFVVKQPDDTLGYIIQRFKDETGTPKYQYMLRKNL